MLRIKAKQIGGVWFTSCAFDGRSRIITKLTDFYLWNIHGESVCRQSKRVMALTYKLCNNDFGEAVELCDFYLATKPR